MSATPAAPALNYEVYGDDDLPALVLLNSLGLGAADWTFQRSALTGKYRVIAIDRRGHGNSPWVAPRNFRTFADDIRTVLDEAGVGRFSLAGISMGGAEAIQLALDIPARIERVFFINSFVEVPAKEAEDRIEAAQASIAAMGFPAYIERTVDYMTHLLPPGEVREQITAHMTATGAEAFLGTMSVLYTVDLFDRLGAVAVPVHVIGSQFDQRVSPDSLTRIAAAIPHSTLQIIPDAGHFPHIDQPESFNAELLRDRSDHRSAS